MPIFKKLQVRPKRGEKHSSFVKAAATMLLAGLIALLLAACGATPTPTVPSAPSELAVNTNVAPRGTSVTITGSNFGTATGTIAVGEASAVVTSWADTAATFTIPEDAVNAFQALTLITPAGSASVENFFVGVEFLGDDLASLAGQHLPQGTAVLLGAKEYAVAAGETVELDNLSLYGRGAANTFVRTSDADSWLHLIVSPSFDVIVTKLAMETHTFTVSPSRTPANNPLTGFSADSTSMSPASRVGKLLEAGTADLLTSAGSITAQATKYGSFTVNEADLKVAAGGAGVAILDLSNALGAFPGDVSLTSVKLEGAGTTWYVVSAGDITIESSTLTSAHTIVASLAGELAIYRSKILLSQAGPTGVGGGQYFGLRSLSVVETEFEGTNASLVLGTFLPGSSSLITLGGTAEIIGSTFTVRDSDFTDTDDLGSLDFSFLSAAVHIGDSTFESDRDFTMVNEMGTVSITGNAFKLGHGDVAAATMSISGGEWGANTALNDNTITFLSNGTVKLDGVNEVAFTNNVVVGHAEAGTAIDVFKSMQQLPLNLTVTGNSFSGFENAVYLSQHCCSVTELFTGVITGNIFDFPILSPPQAAFIGTGLKGTLDLSNNRWGDHSDVATVETLIVNSSAPDLEIALASLMP